MAISPGEISFEFCITVHNKLVVKLILAVMLFYGFLEWTI